MKNATPAFPKNRSSYTAPFLIKKINAEFYNLIIAVLVKN